SLGEELNTHNPKRVRPPAMHSSYSNHGTAMAAYIVEKVSGLSWDQYVQEHIFDPLGMKKTSFKFSLPQALRANHAQGYTYNEGQYRSHSFKNIPLAPVGLAATTAEDMLPFMAAHLNHGRYGDVQLLDSATSAEMQSPLHVHAEGLRGMCYGFFDHSRNGYKIIGHGGATEYFFSFMLLMPEEEVGIFISTNTQNGTDLIRKATNAFFDRYFPAKSSPEVHELADDDLEKFTGTYLSNRRPRTRFTKLVALFNTPLEVKVKEGKLITGGENTQIWYPIGAETFQDSKSTDRIAFGKDEEGKYSFLYRDASPHVAYERVSTLESRGFNLFVLIMSLGLGIFACIYWLLSLGLKNVYRLDRSADLPATSKFLLGLNVLILIVFAFLYGATLDSAIPHGIKTSDYFTFILAGGFALLSLVQMVLALRHFSRSIKLRSKLFYFLISLGMLALVFLMNYWKLLGFHF
ncbi:MAG: serine hydrolase, partial [Bacteroidota bacterium]